MSAQGMMGDYPAGVAGHRAYDVAFDASRVVPTGPENVPQHIWQPVILYLGRPR